MNASFISDDRTVDETLALDKIPCEVNNDPERLGLVFRDQDSVVDEVLFRDALSGLLG
jgi:hypothetical protein